MTSHLTPLTVVRKGMGTSARPYSAVVFPPNMADTGVGKDLLAEIQNAFNNDTKNLIVQNVGTQYDPLEVCLDRNVAETVNHVYKHKVPA